MLKLDHIQELSKHPLILDRDFCIARAPGRISFSKHCDYVNNDLLYFADDRSTFAAISSETGFGEINIANLDSKYPSYKLQARDLGISSIPKNSWLSYPWALLVSLQKKYSIDFSDLNLNIVVSSQIPAAGGLSSSHALLLSLCLALAQRLDLSPLLQLIEERSIDLLKLVQEIENTRGFNSGLGDPAAQMLALTDHLVFIKLEPQLEHSYLKLPPHLALITAPSFIAADKSLPEFAEANANIAAYKTLNNLASQIFNNKNLHYLGDALDYFSEDEICKELQKIQDPSLRGLALYALSEGARLRYLRNKASELSEEELLSYLGHHLNLSHQAEKLAQDKLIRCQVDPSLSLREQSGYYGASTPANDDLQELALSLEGVYGSSISGAGLGGNNIILCSKDKAPDLLKTLIQEYYEPRGLKERALKEVHISHSSAAASLVTH